VNQGEGKYASPSKKMGEKETSYLDDNPNFIRELNFE
jgi:hypothetical protein